jgi:hypothetical protein
MHVDLSGQVTLVTGASRGVGKGIALGLGERGTRLHHSPALALEYGFTDVDGKQPRPLTREQI